MLSVEPSAHSQEVLCRHVLTAFYSPQVTQRRGPSGQELPGAPQEEPCAGAAEAGQNWRLPSEKRGGGA